MKTRNIINIILVMCISCLCLLNPNAENVRLFLCFSFAGTTIITITLIAFNRYKLILDPGAYTELYSRRNIFIMLLVAWLVPVACLTPAVIGIWGTFGYVPMLVTCNLLLDHRSLLFKIFLMVVRAGFPCGLIVYFKENTI
jgi:hypothetical protein